MMNPGTRSKLPSSDISKHTLVALKEPLRWTDAKKTYTEVKNKTTTAAPDEPTPTELGALRWSVFHHRPDWDNGVWVFFLRDPPDWTKSKSLGASVFYKVSNEAVLRSPPGLRSSCYGNVKGRKHRVGFYSLREVLMRHMFGCKQNKKRERVSVRERERIPLCKCYSMSWFNDVMVDMLKVTSEQKHCYCPRTVCLTFSSAETSVFQEYFLEPSFCLFSTDGLLKVIIECASTR